MTTLKLFSHAVSMLNVVLGLFLLGVIAYFMIDPPKTSTPNNEKLLASAVMDSSGDGSAVQRTPRVEDNLCNCWWENGIVSGTPYSTDKTNGICYFVNKGEPVFGNLDVSKKVCNSVVDGKTISAVAYLYLTGKGCSPMFKPRQYCGPAMPLEPTGAVCVTKDGRFGHSHMKNGMWTCSTSNGGRTTEVCSEFSYESLDTTCKIPSTL